MTSIRKMRLAQLSTLAAATLLAVGTFGATVPPAQADVATFNPFEVNGGFTVLAQGDAVLGNGELEGTVAAFGSVSSTRDNFPVRHHHSGMPDYSVPIVDGDPVRILARQFAGAGGIDLHNEGSDENGESAPTEPAAQAIAKFTDVSGLTAHSESGGFVTRVINTDNGRLDLKALPYSVDVIDKRVHADRDNVEAYFDTDAQLDRANQCLSAMYAPAVSAVNVVDFTTDGSSLIFIRSLDTARPNVLFYEDIQGKIIKLEGEAEDYEPSASAPLIVKVRGDGGPGRIEINEIDVEEWSASADREQSYARHIMIDASEITGTVKINHLELGSIWAPNADLEFESGVNSNGQWFAKNVTTGGAEGSGGGEIHHHTFGGALPCPAGGSITLAKAVAGDGAALVGDVEFTFDLTIGDTTQVVRLAAGESRTFHGLPGSRVTVSEEQPADPAGAVFDGVRFTVDGSPVDTVDLAIQAEAHQTIVATNAFSADPDPLLALVKNVPNGEPTDWTLTATAPDGTRAVTGQGTATGPVTAGVPYTLAESGGPAEYVQDGEWQCVNDDGAKVPVDAGATTVVVQHGAHVTCTVTNITATVTLLKLVTGDSDLLPAAWELSATPSGAADGLREAVVLGGESPSAGNTFVVRPERDYVLDERPTEGVPSASLLVAVERYVGTTPDAPDHSVPSDWQRVEPRTITVDRGAHEVYRFVNFVPTPIDLPVLGGPGGATLLTVGAGIAAAGLATAVVLHRRRPRSAT